MVEPLHRGPGEQVRAGADEYDRLAALASDAPQRIERTFTTRIHTVEDDWVSLTALDDDFHSMRIALRVRTDGTIVEAAGRMLKNPFDTCPRAVASLGSLVGESVFGGGTSARTGARIPRTEGCLHLVDMLAVAFRAFKIARGHDMPWPAEDDRRMQIMELVPFVRDTCISFAVEPEGP